MANEEERPELFDMTKLPQVTVDVVNKKLASADCLCAILILDKSTGEIFPVTNFSHNPDHELRVLKGMAQIILSVDDYTHKVGKYEH